MLSSLRPFLQSHKRGADDGNLLQFAFSHSLRFVVPLLLWGLNKLLSLEPLALSQSYSNHDHQISWFLFTEVSETYGSPWEAFHDLVKARAPTLHPSLFSYF